MTETHCAATGVVGGPRGESRPRSTWTPGLLALSLVLGLLAPLRVAADDISNHPGDVFVRLDRDGGGTLVFRFDAGEVSDEASFAPIWTPDDDTEGLSVDKFERIVTVKGAGTEEESRTLGTGEYMYYDMDADPPQWVGPLGPITGTSVVPVPEGANRLYVPDLVTVLRCNAGSNPGDACKMVHWGHGVKCPSLHRYPSGMSASNWPQPPSDGKYVVGFNRWFLGSMDEGLKSNSVGNRAPYGPGDPWYENRCSDPSGGGAAVPGIHWGQEWNALAKANEIIVESELKQVIAFMNIEGTPNDVDNLDNADDRTNIESGDLVQGGTGRESTVGDVITANVSSQTKYELFSSCGDSCITGAGNYTGPKRGVTPPTRVLFGSEGRTFSEQKAYTIRNDAGSLAVERMTLLPNGTWEYSPVDDTRIVGTPHPDGTPFSEAVVDEDNPPDVTFGNAASIDSIDPGADDFIYKGNADQDHYAVSSRFWRNGGTVFHYSDDASGKVHWIEHSFPGTGSFTPSSNFADMPQGDIRIGTDVYAITADGAGNLYWLFRDLDPPNTGGAYPNPSDFIENPDDLNPGPVDDWESWPATSTDPGSLPGNEAIYYLRQEDQKPPPNNPAYPPFRRWVYLQQNPSYRLFQYNYLASGRQPDVDTSTLPVQPASDFLPGELPANIVVDRGRLTNGAFVRKYLATAPQVDVPDPVEVEVTANEERTVTWSSVETEITSCEVVDIPKDCEACGFQAAFNSVQSPVEGEPPLGPFEKRTWPRGTVFRDDTVCNPSHAYWNDLAVDPDACPVDLVAGDLPEDDRVDSCGPWSGEVRVNKENPAEGYFLVDERDCTITNAHPREFVFRGDDPDDVFSKERTDTDPGYEDRYTGGGNIAGDIADEGCDDFPPPANMSGIKYEAHTNAVRTIRRSREFVFEYPRGKPGTFDWTDDPPVALPDEGLVEEEFDLDVAAVNVTEPPDPLSPITVFDIAVFEGADADPESPDAVAVQDPIPALTEGRTYTFRVENPPRFDGLFTSSEWGNQNGNFLQGDQDNDTVEGTFAASMLQIGLRWRWRVYARSGAARYAYDNGAPKDPSPGNDGMLFKSDWEILGDGELTPQMVLNSGSFEFEDPGEYLMILDIGGSYWNTPGNLDFFSRPEDLSFLPFYGVYDAGVSTTMDSMNSSDWGDMDTAFPGGFGSPDRAEFDGCNPNDEQESIKDGSLDDTGPSCFARIYQVVNVGPGGPDQDDLYITNMSPLASEAPPVYEDLSDGLPDSTRETPPPESTDTEDDITGVAFTMRVKWYTGTDYVVDQALGGALPQDDFGAVEFDPEGEDMAKLGGVGTYFRPDECPDDDDAVEQGLNEANLALLREGLLAARDDDGDPTTPSDYSPCQTQVARAPRKRDWDDIEYWWYMRVPDPRNPAAALVPPDPAGLDDAPDPNDPEAGTVEPFGVLVSKGTLGDLWEMQQGSLQGFRDTIVGQDVLSPIGADAELAREWEVTLPLYGRDGSGNPVPLEISMPTDPEKVKFTVVVRYPVVDWVPVTDESGAPELDEEGRVKWWVASNGGSRFGAYRDVVPYQPGTVPDWGSDAVSLLVQDRTPPEAEEISGALSAETFTAATVRLNPSAPAPYDQAVADNLMPVKVKDNNPYQADPHPTPTDFRYTLGGATADRRVADRNIWAGATTYGLGLTTDGGQFGFDLSHDPDSGLPSFLELPPTANESRDFVGARPNGHDSFQWLYLHGTDPPGVGTSVIATSASAPPYFVARSPATAAPHFDVIAAIPPEIVVGADAPRNWVRYRVDDPNTFDGDGNPDGLAPFDETRKVVTWGIESWRLPTPPFVASGQDTMNFFAKGIDAADNAGTVETTLGSQTLRDFSPPNVVVEIVDQKSGQAVYFAAVTDHRQAYSESLARAHLTTPGDWVHTRIMVSPDPRPVMEDEARAELVHFSGNRFKHPGSNVYDFSDLDALPPALASLGLPASGPGEAYRWRVEEDVMFRVRAIVTDNASPPDALAVGIRSTGTGSTSNPLRPAPRSWSVGAPPTLGQESIVDGKAVMQTHHRYSLEGETDQIEVYAEDGQNNVRILRIEVAARAHDTDFRVISDRVRRGPGSE